MLFENRILKTNVSAVFKAALLCLFVSACAMNITAEGYLSSRSYRTALRAVESAEDAADRLLDYARDARFTSTAENTLERRLDDVCDELEDLSEDDVSNTQYRTLERDIETLSEKTYATLRYMGYQTYTSKYRRFERKIDNIESALKDLR